MNKGLVIFGILLIVISTVLGFFTGESIVDDEQLCVDGNNNKNLEGIMCEKSHFEYLGIDGNSGLYIIIFFGILGFGMYIIGLFWEFGQ